MCLYPRLSLPRLGPLQGRDALPSKRYLTIIRDGAAESGLDEGYCRWLATLDHYEARTLGQKLGRLLFAGVTFMLLSPSFVLLRLYRKWRGVENGSPRWLQAMFRFIFRTVWVLHEALRPLLGCGATNVAAHTAA